MPTMLLGCACGQGQHCFDLKNGPGALQEQSRGQQPAPHGAAQPGSSKVQEKESDVDAGEV